MFSVTSFVEKGLFLDKVNARDVELFLTVIG